MSEVLRAWVVAVGAILVLLVVVGLIASTDPADGVIRAAGWASVVLPTLVVALWYRRRRPDAPVGEYALAVLPFPLLLVAAGLFVNHRAGLENDTLVTRGVVNALLVLAVAAAGHYLPQRVQQPRY